MAGRLFHECPNGGNGHQGTENPRRAVSQQSRWNVHRCYGQSPIDVIVLRNGWGGRDYDNDGWPDLFITCLSGNVLYHNNGDGTFTDVTAKAGVADGRWSTGAAFGDYDGDRFVDLMVSNYVDFRLNDLPGFGSSPNRKFRGIDVQCGPRGLKGAGDSLFHNNGDGTFTEVSKSAGVSGYGV